MASEDEQPKMRLEAFGHQTVAWAPKKITGNRPFHRRVIRLVVVHRPAGQKLWLKLI